MNESGRDPEELRIATAAVRTYLDMLGRRTRGGLRTMSRTTVLKRLADIDAAMQRGGGDARARTRLDERQRHFTELLTSLDSGDDPERDFVEHAALFARHNNISYDAFRLMEVPSALLKRAGVFRTPKYARPPAPPAHRRTV